MGIRLKAQRARAKVNHPTIPGVYVEIERPRRVELLEFQTELAKYEEEKVMLNPATGMPIFDPHGKLVKETKSKVPPDVMIGFFGRHVVAIGGVDLEDKDGKLVSLVRSTVTGPAGETVFPRAGLEALMEPDFDVKVKRPVPKQDATGEVVKDATGEVVKEMKEQDISFYQLLIDRLYERETFGLDPLVPDSGKQSTHA